jgi:hypothetical protein
MKFKYHIGQKIENEQVGEIVIDFRWHGRDVNFYDVIITRCGSKWTYDETEVVKGHSLTVSPIYYTKVGTSR